MASKNRVFGRPLPDASVPRNAFDMSKVINMNMPFGAIIPCYVHQYIAGSHVKINVSTFFRTARVNTAAFPRLKMETEFFAVPIRYLWSYWDNFKLGIQDINSSALYNEEQGSFQPSAVPSFNIADLWDHIVEEKANPIAYDAAGFPWYQGAKRLLDMLKYGRFKESLFTSHSTYVQRMNLFAACAYQKVYYDHFRNTAYEVNDPMAYNLDFYFSHDAEPDTTQQLEKFFMLRYANYRKDYFQHIFPSLNYVGDTSVSPARQIPSWIQGLADLDSAASVGYDTNRWTTSGGASLPRSTNVMTSASSDTLVAERNGTPVNALQHNHLLNVSPVFFRPQAIRAAFALDKLQRSIAYAPRHVKEQYEARYGIKFSNKSSYESYRIGSFDTDIVIGEVTSTANTATETTGDYLGDIGGKGVGSTRGNHWIEFTCPEDCIVIGVNYAIPRTCYDSYRFDNFNMKLAPTDFFIPEYMNLGLKPLYGKELTYIQYNQYGTPELVSESFRNAPLGYQTPYMEYKCDVDENHGLFADVNSDLGQFVVHTNINHATSSYVGGVRYNYFKVNPGDLDSIFFTSANGDESSDHLFGEMQFTIPVNQNMSVHGQPTL